MNRLFKGRTNNHISWAMVDATDFATPESALSAATKIKIYGKLRGGTGVNFVSSGTGSLVNDIQHVGASVLGLYTIALAKADLSDASAAWYDQYIISLSATGAAYQALVCEGVIDDSTLMSRVLLVQSQASDAYSAIIAPLASMTSDIASAVWAHTVGTRVDSRVLLAQSMASDAASAAAQVNSRVLLVQSRLSDFDSRLVSDVSDIRSMLSDMMSDFQSRVPKAVATNSQLSDLHSDLRSFLVVMSGIQSDVYSALSDMQSDFQSRVPKRVATDSQLSDALSDLRSLLGAGVVISASDMSDIRSAITAVTAAVSASDMSDIASRVWATAIGTRVDSRLLVVQSMASDAASAAVQANSRILLTQSMASDLQSKLSDVESNLLSFLTTTGVLLNTSAISDIRSAITAITATLSASDLSDIRSAITASTSDIRSYLSSTAPVLSDMASAVWNEKYHANSAASTFGSLFSVLATNAAAGASRALLNQSYLSDVRSQLTAGLPLTASDMSDLRSAITAVTAAVSASDMSDIASRVWATAIGTAVSSRVLVIQSMVSDTQSKLSDVESNLLSVIGTTGVQLNASSLSDLRSAIAALTFTLGASDISDIASAVLAGAGTTTISASDMSDIASRVWAMAAATTLTSRMLVVQSMASDAASAAQQANSRILVTQSMASDLQSKLSDVESNLLSVIGTTGVQLNASSLSDIRSAITGATFTLGASDISDIASAVRATVASDLSDILSAAQQVNSRLLLTKSMVSDIQSAVAVIPATKLAQHALGVLAVVIGSGSTTTSVKFSTVEGGSPSAVDDFYNGAVIVFTSGALLGQRTSISDYTGSTTTATVVALTGSPVNAVTAVVV